MAKNRQKTLAAYVTELGSSYEENRKLEKLLSDCEEKLTREQEKSDRFLAEIRGFERDAELDNWLIDHLIAYVKDIERITKE